MTAMSARISPIVSTTGHGSLFWLINGERVRSSIACLHAASKLTRCSSTSQTLSSCSTLSSLSASTSSVTFVPNPGVALAGRSREQEPLEVPVAIATSSTEAELQPSIGGRHSARSLNTSAQRPCLEQAAMAALWPTGSGWKRVPPNSANKHNACSHAAWRPQLNSACRYASEVAAGEPYASEVAGEPLLLWAGGSRSGRAPEEDIA
mmetsp:Transcript_69947/g.138544  ORF Transcript_69947/g.138544 Transcript_69947/m.138544 type:complete len:207 (-) Transcript_69947:7-627(-)